MGETEMRAISNKSSYADVTIGSASANFSDFARFARWIAFNPLERPRHMTVSSAQSRTLSGSSPL
jgi:hypothetical protein